jgi:DNA modification methylase
MIKIIHGDCLQTMKEIPDKSIDCIITDPPYGIDYQSARRTDKSQWKPKIANDKTPCTIWTDEAFRIMKENTSLLCFTRWDTEHDFRQALTNSGFVCKQQIIWDKVVHGMGDLTGDFASQHENIIFAHKGRFTFKGKRPKSIFRVQRVTPTELKHPNEKPVDLMEKLVSSITCEKDIVLDLFAGIGTTGVACKNLNRSFIGIELDENYFNIAEERINGTPNNK